MFANLLFIISVLLIISLVPEFRTEISLFSPLIAFSLGLLLYVALLVVIYLQNVFLLRKWKISAETLHNIVNIEMLTFFVVFYFIFAAQRVWGLLPYPISEGAHSQFLLALFSLLIYFFALAIFYYTSNTSPISPAKNMVFQLRMLIPFSLPFLFFALLIDIVQFIPKDYIPEVFLEVGGATLFGQLMLVGISFLFLGLTMVFFPLIIKSIWLCKPIENQNIQHELDAFCKKVHFKHSGMLTWTVLDRFYTAGIIGLIPNFRYVMFTKSLLNHFSVSELKAILAHEIGHSKNKHLLIYPLIIFGMLVSIGLFSLFFAEPINYFFARKQEHYPSSIWNAVGFAAIFICYVCIIGIYFRFIFGFFSRLFERQADLHVLKLQVPVEDIVSALNHVGDATGDSHDAPSWHHYSINQRIHTLKNAHEHPELIQKHDRRVVKFLIIYMVLLIMTFSIMISPLLPEAPIFKNIANFISKFNLKIISNMNDYNYGITPILKHLKTITLG